MFRIALLFIISCVHTYAVDLEVKLTFDKRPTPCGMIYMLNDDSLTKEGVKTLTVTQKGKKFKPRLIAAAKDSKVIIKNDDTIQHSVYANDTKNNVTIDHGMKDPNEDITQTITWKEGAVAKFGCRIHPEMALYIAHVKTKHHKCFDMEKKDKETKVVIANVPSDEKEYKLWLPLYDEMKVKIKAGETKKIDIVRKGKKRGEAVFTAKNKE